MAWRAKQKKFSASLFASWNSAFTLAAWRWRTQRFLLLIVGAGMTIAITLVSALPLFSQAMNTAGLRGVLRAQPNATQVLAKAQLRGISSSLVANASSQIDQLFNQYVGHHYFVGAPQATIITGDWGGAPISTDFYGVPIKTAQAHLHLLQGRLPTPNTTSSSDIEIMLTRSAALYQGNLKVGDTLQLTAQWQPSITFGAQIYTTTVRAHLVGIFRVNRNDPFWDGYDLEEPPPMTGAPQPSVLALTDQPSLLHMLDSIIGQQSNAQSMNFGYTKENEVLFSYTLNAAKITSNDLQQVIAGLGALQQNISQTFISNVGLLNIDSVQLSGLPVHDPTQGADGNSILEKYNSQVQVTQVPTLILTAEILCLILLFISMMVGALIEREQAAIAVLRSRGADRGQVFGSLLTQGLVICVVASLLGPILALGLVWVATPHFLTASTRDALNALTLHASATLGSLLLFALIAALASFLTLLLPLYLATRANVLTLRREEARTRYKPLWQRLYLDLAAAALALIGYALTLYLENSQALLSVQSQILVSAPLQLLAPLLLLIAGILCFQRLFPLTLSWLARLAQQRRGLTSMLALVQMERSPRRPLSMTLLLGLATAFALFSLVFLASQGQRAQDLATYQAVSDFSGYTSALPATTPETSAAILQQSTTRYQQIKGVTSVCIGSMQNTYLSLDANTDQAYEWPTRLLAVDANTFARTAIWTSQDSSQSLADLMALLIARRPQAQAQGVVPAIVAASTWQQLGLHPGATFHLVDSGANVDPTVYQAVAEVNHIPPVDDGSEGALLVDYQSLLNGQAHALSPDEAPLNYIWLRSGNDLTEVNEVRSALHNSSLALENVQNRRALSRDNAADPLANKLIGILATGVSVTLLLALLANLLLPLLSMRARQTNFAVLRALGTAPRQVRNILAWEMAIVQAISLVLGLLFGALLTLTAVPPLVFTGALPGSLASLSGDTIYSLQQIVPIQIILPSSLLLALLVLLALCILAPGVLARLAQRPLLAQTLRLNED